MGTGPIHSESRMSKKALGLDKLDMNAELHGELVSDNENKCQIKEFTDKSHSPLADQNAIDDAFNLTPINFDKLMN